MAAVAPKVRSALASKDSRDSRESVQDEEGPLLGRHEDTRRVGGAFYVCIAAFVFAATCVGLGFVGGVWFNGGFVGKTSPPLPRPHARGRDKHAVPTKQTAAGGAAEAPSFIPAFAEDGGYVEAVSPPPEPPPSSPPPPPRVTINPPVSITSQPPITTAPVAKRPHKGGFRGTLFGTRSKHAATPADVPLPCDTTAGAASGFKTCCTKPRATSCTGAADSHACTGERSHTDAIVLVVQKRHATYDATHDSLGHLHAALSSLGNCAPRRRTAATRLRLDAAAHPLCPHMIDTVCPLHAVSLRADSALREADILLWHEGDCAHMHMAT